ncbi:MAG: hypothetical protein V1678_01080 [Candidatus Aenigmatarchaeota archaeon]
MLTTPEDIASFSEECFAGLTNMLGVSLKPPKLDIKPVNYRADDILDFIDERAKYLRSYHRHLDRAFRTGIPDEDIIVAQAEDETIERYFMADYEHKDDTLRVSQFPSVNSLECFHRKLGLRPIRSSKDEIMQLSGSLHEAISGELMRAIRAKAIGYDNKPKCPDVLTVAQRLDRLDVRSFENLNDKEFRSTIRRGRYRLHAILDNRDFFSALGYLMGPKAVKSKAFVYEPTMNYETVPRIIDALDAKASLENSAWELLKKEQNFETPFNNFQYDAYLPVMADICFTHYIGGNGFMKKHVYSKEDPIIKREPGKIFSDFL